MSPRSMRDFDYFAQNVEVADWKQISIRSDIPAAVRAQLRSFRRKTFLRFAVVGMSVALMLVAASIFWGDDRVPRAMGAVILVVLSILSAQLGIGAWRHWRKGPFDAAGADDLTNAL